jgi:NAD(P)-dependent dehydrogenase (short-subunit alcohol dehydrogenase family)
MSILDRFSLAGKAALVTGASSGLGAGFAVALAQAGADVGLAARRRDGLEAARREVEKLGRSARDLNQQWSGRRGIRVNAVAPGYFRSEMTEQIPPDKLGEFIASTSTLAGWASSTSSTPWSCSWPAPPPPTSPASRWPSTAACPGTERHYLMIARASWRAWSVGFLVLVDDGAGLQGVAPEPGRACTAHPR